MLIGVPKEIKNNEFRVGLTPASVHDTEPEEDWYEPSGHGDAANAPGMST